MLRKQLQDDLANQKRRELELKKEPEAKQATEKMSLDPSEVAIHLLGMLSVSIGVYLMLQAIF